MIGSRLPHYLFLLMLSILLFIPGSLLSQYEQQQIRMVDTIDTSVDLFDETSPMHITLTLDLKKYQREKNKGEYMPVHFLYEINDTLQSEKTMRLKARGQFRRSHCNLAPFWLNIRKADVKNAHLQDINRIKIVTHCKGAKAYEEYVLKEYLAYKIYSIISPVSFRVRLLKMTYVDSGRKNRITEGWAFMIEPEAMLAQRTGALVVKKDELTTRLMRPGEIDVVALFQYMIGNADYSVAGRHNLKILGLPGFGSEGYTPVPYDFDYSGLVDAYYAIPGENLGLTSVRDRYYLGPCREDEDFIAAIEHINQCREEILRLVTGCEYLDPEYKNGAIRYLEEYFELAGHHQSFIHSLQRTCR
ncbi:MAG: hypothetical protein K8R52_07560 [Bacteroidales bacterium]|nr:hypothetical protein [Bacteroidales bacterium]